MRLNISLQIRQNLNNNKITRANIYHQRNSIKMFIDLYTLQLINSFCIIEWHHQGYLYAEKTSFFKTKIVNDNAKILVGSVGYYSPYEGEEERCDSSFYIKHSTIYRPKKIITTFICYKLQFPYHVTKQLRVKLINFTRKSLRFI